MLALGLVVVACTGFLEMCSDSYICGTCFPQKLKMRLVYVLWFVGSCGMSERTKTQILTWPSLWFQSERRAQICDGHMSSSVQLYVIWDGRGSKKRVPQFGKISISEARTMMTMKKMTRFFMLGYVLVTYGQISHTFGETFCTHLSPINPPDCERSGGSPDSGIPTAGGWEGFRTPDSQIPNSWLGLGKSGRVSRVKAGPVA